MGFAMCKNSVLLCMFLFLTTLYLPLHLFSSENTEMLPLEVVKKHFLRPVGIIFSIKGKVNIINFDGSSHRATLKSVLYVGDTLKTGHHGKVQICFIDDTVICLNNNADFTVPEFSFEKDKIGATIGLINGGFEFMVGKMAKKAAKKFRIETSTASAGIRGSGGHGWVSDGSRNNEALLRIATVEGHVLVITSKTGATAILDDPSNGVEVDKNGNIKYFEIQGDLSQEYTPPRQQHINPLQVIINNSNRLQNTTDSTPLALITGISSFPFEHRTLPYLSTSTRVRIRSRKKRKNRNTTLENDSLNIEGQERSISDIDEKENASPQKTLKRWTKVLAFFKMTKRALTSIFNR